MLNLAAETVWAGLKAVNPSVEHGEGGIVVSGISTWPNWTFVVAAAESSVKVIPPNGQLITPRLWKALPIGYVLRLAATTWTAEELTRVLRRHDDGLELPRRPLRR